MQNILYSMLPMPTMNDVLYVPIVTQMQPIVVLTRQLYEVVDEESHTVLEQLLRADIVDDSSLNIEEMGIMDPEKDIPFSQIPSLIKKENFIPVSPNHCIYFLSILKGKRSTDKRRSFFGGGKIFLSTELISIDGESYCLAIGQDHCERKKGQRPFSIRLITPPTVFLHSLYRVLVAKV